jgi:arylsulfatase A-like enzyme
LSGNLGDAGDQTTLIDDFQANGYVAVYVSGQDESFGGPRYDIGFSRADVSFDARSDRARRYTTFTTAGSLAVPFSVVEERVAESLARVPADRPLFVYVNFHDTHFPYTHEGVETLASSARLPRHRIVPGERQELWATYANTAANVDRAIGNVLASVRRQRGSNPAVIVTADHGESLFEDGFIGHGHALNDVQTRVPLIVTNLPMVLDEPFGHVDLRPAIGAAMRTPASASAQPGRRGRAEREVFQYLGTVNRPRQIALRGSVASTVFDFRTRQLQIRGGGWRRPEALRGQERSEFLRLVHFWERIMLARHTHDGDE